MLSTMTLGKYQISRFIAGGNPISGNSHVSRAMDSDMEDYFTCGQIKKTLFRCMECGVNSVVLRGDRHIIRVLREFRAEGGKLQWMGQTIPEAISYEGNVKQIAAAGAISMHHHGTVTDDLFKAGKYDELKRRLLEIRKTGLLVGLGTHMPEVLEYAEEHNWDVDYYMACVYNISRIDRISSAITGKSNEEEPFFDEDIPVMYKTIKSVSKPCLAFKILGATRRCQTQETVKQCFNEAFQSIKPGDAVVVGVYPKDMDQIAINAEYTQQAIAGVK